MRERPLFLACCLLLVGPAAGLVPAAVAAAATYYNAVHASVAAGCYAFTHGLGTLGAAKAAGAAHVAGTTHYAGAASIGALTSGHSVATGTAAGLATGTATGLVAQTPEAIVKILRNDEKPSTQAIGRIIGIEWKRLKQAARVGDPNPAEVAKRVASKARDRAPIIVWALDLWVRSKLGIDKNEAKPGSEGHSVRRARSSSRSLSARARRLRDPCASFVDPLGIWGDTNFRVPNIWTSLRVLELELASQIKFGMRTAPLRVLRLGVSALIVTVVALMAQLPGFAWFKRMVEATWPGLVEHLAATLERNLEEDPSKVLASDRSARWGAAWRRYFPIKEGVGFLVGDNGGTLRGRQSPLDRPDGMHPTKKVLTTRGPVYVIMPEVVPRQAPLRLEPGPMDWIMRWT